MKVLKDRQKHVDQRWREGEATEDFPADRIKVVTQQDWSGHGET